jgi:hypothetical protein
VSVISTSLTVVPIQPKQKKVEYVKLPPQHDDVWQRIRSQLSITVPDNEEVAKWRDYYLSHPNFMVTISRRAELFYIILLRKLKSVVCR